MREVRFRGRRREVVPVAILPVTAVQMRLALHRAGLLETVNAIAASSDEARIVWENATEILRDSPLIGALQGNALRPFTNAEIDALFLAAARI